MSIIPAHLKVFQHVPPIRYAVDPVSNLIFVEWVGVVTTEDLFAHWSEYLTNEAVMNSRRNVVDLTGAIIRISGADLNYLIQRLVKPTLEGKGWITALIVSNDYQYGVSRQYGAYAEHYSTDQIFKSAPEAIAWIKEQGLNENLWVVEGAVAI